MEYDVANLLVSGAQLQPTRLERINIVTSLPPSPVAGADARITVPNGVLWDMQSMTAKLTTSAAAANRLIGFIVRDQNGQTVYQYQCTTALIASKTLTVTFSEDCSLVPTTIADTNTVLFPSPRAWFGGGWTFGTFTGAIDAADQWSLTGLWAAEYLPADGL